MAAHHFGLYGEAFNPYGAVSLAMRIPEGGDRFVSRQQALGAVQVQQMPQPEPSGPALSR